MGQATGIFQTMKVLITMMRRNLISYLCSDEASLITGCDYPIDGRFTKLNT
jgi:hypothetical protein